CPPSRRYPGPRRPRPPSIFASLETPLSQKGQPRCCLQTSLCPGRLLPAGADGAAPERRGGCRAAPEGERAPAHPRGRCRGPPPPDALCSDECFFGGRTSFFQENLPPAGRPSRRGTFGLSATLLRRAV